MTILACMTIFSEEHGNEGSPPCTVGKKQWAAMHACVSTCMHQHGTGLSGTKITYVLQVGVPVPPRRRAVASLGPKAASVVKELQVACAQSVASILPAIKHDSQRGVRKAQQRRIKGILLFIQAIPEDCQSRPLCTTGRARQNSIGGSRQQRQR